MPLRDYNKTELINRVDKISIERVSNQVITKYDNRVIKVSNVSKIYEVFDISKYLNEKIELIEKNFDIKKYEFIIKGGIQYLKLISDKININGVDFYKSFYILNSSDRSRRLRFNVGLCSEGSKFQMISNVSNIGIDKKHLVGVTKLTNESTSEINNEVFSEQIDLIKSLVGHQVSFSKIREVILGDDKDIPKVNHLKFDSFKNSIRYLSSDGRISLRKDQIDLLYLSSDRINQVDKSVDFSIDAFQVFMIYLRIFNKQDSHIIKNETDRIMGITKWKFRSNLLESIGI